MKIWQLIQANRKMATPLPLHIISDLGEILRVKEPFNVGSDAEANFDTNLQLFSLYFTLDPGRIPKDVQELINTAKLETVEVKDILLKTFEYITVNDSGVVKEFKITKREYK